MEKIRGCGLHTSRRWDIQYESAFGEFFHFDCLQCRESVSKNPNICETCQKWNFADYVFKDSFAGDVIDSPRALAEYTERSDCLVCRALLDAILEMLGGASQGTATDKVMVVNCGPYKYEGTVSDNGEHIINLRARNGTGKCVFLLLISPNASEFYADRMRLDEPRTGLGDETASGPWSDCFLPVPVELKYDMSGHGLLEVARWEKSFLEVADLRKEIVENDAPQSDAVQGELPKGFRLIDTFERCIVEPSSLSSTRFVTLSYTWGSSAGQPCDDLTKDRLDTMKQVGALREENYPYVIWDAIKLCQDLGERYLWTDRLCILQDDPEDLGRQVSQMDRIYGQASLCIASVVNHELDKGLPGVRGRPRRSPLENKTRHFSNHVPNVEYDLEAMLDRSDWNTRGWTFQERILSRQCIFISNFNWCLLSGSTVYHEDLGKLDSYFLQANTAGRRSISDPYGLAVNSHDYMDLMAHYTQRRLSFRTDALNAFSGIANVVSKQNQTRYLFGLFEKYLVEGLLWGYSGSEAMTADLPHVPTWSWARWNGAANFQSLYTDAPHCDNDYYGPLVKFSYSHPSDGAVELNQEKRWFGQRYDGDLPDVADYPTLRTKETKKDPESTIAKWRACPHNPWTNLEHQDLALNKRDLAKEFPGALLFATTVASLSLSLEDSDQDSGLNIFILNPTGQKIGLLMRGTSKAWTDTWLFPDKKFDFIVISAGRPPSDVGLNAKKRSPEDPIRQLWGYEKYTEAEPLWTLNLMLVEMGEEGEWRRLAIGFVVMECWAGCEPEWEGVVLG